MAIKETELLTKKLKICETCTNCDYNKKEYKKLAICKLKNTEVGLFEYCKNWNNARD